MGTYLSIYEKGIYIPQMAKRKKKLLIPFNIVNCFASISRPNNIPLIHSTTTNDNAALAIGNC